jgi:hypothetical protein
MKITRLWGVLLLLLAVGGAGSVSAQDVPVDPVATVEAGDFRALAVMQNGTRLLVADAAANQVRVYDISAPGEPEQIAAVSISGEPAAMAAAGDFAVVGVNLDGGGAAIEVIAQSPYSRRRPYVSLTYIEMPGGIERVALSPDGRWGVVISAGRYTLLEILSPEEINSATLDGGGILDAAIADSRLFLARADGLTVERLASGPTAETLTTLAGSWSMLAVNPAQSVVGGQQNGALALLDSGDLALLAQADAGGAAALDFLSGDVDLVALNGSRTQLQLYNVNSSRAQVQIEARGTVDLGAPIRQMTAFDSLIFVTDGTRVAIYGVR